MKIYFQTEIPFQGDGIPYFRYDRKICKKKTDFSLHCWQIDPNSDRDPIADLTQNRRFKFFLK